MIRFQCPLVAHKGVEEFPDFSSPSLKVGCTSGAGLLRVRDCLEKVAYLYDTRVVRE